MKMTTKTILLLFLVVISCACKNTNEPTDHQGITVKTVLVKTGLLRNQKELPFISKPFRTSELSFRVGGPIDRFEVYAGNYYKRGHIIAEIDSRDFRIRKERTEATHQQAKAEFERTKVLYEKNNISASAFEKANANHISAKAAYEMAVNELEDTKLVAPFNGYIGEVYIEKHQDVKASQPIISFIDIDQLKIEAYVTQDIAAQAQTLKKVGLQFDAAPGQTYEAKIIEVSKSTTQNNLSFLLTALLPNPDGKLLAGMSGKLFFDLPATTPQTTSIPQTALCHRPSEGDYVWVVNTQNRKVSKRSVVPGELLDNGQISVKQGLEVNETVATSGLRFLSEGTTVQTVLQNP